MFYHCVYFWLKDDLTEADRNRFNSGVASLTTISSVKQAHVGVPAPTDRPVIDRSYSCALIVSFETEADHDAYQVDPVHDRFRDECAGFWSRVQIYDSIDEA